MKKIKILMMMIMVLSISIASAANMSISSVRDNTRFLTDKMAYELRLNSNQIDDVYEVNYDFVTNVRYLMDDVVVGDRYAIDKYYDYLDNRNDDLRWILSDSQYRKFISIEYFYKPLYTYTSGWSFRVFNHYTNISHFYYPRPSHFYSYSGGHYRTLFNNISYYKTYCPGRYGNIRFHKKFVTVRPNHYHKPTVIVPGRPSRPTVIVPGHHDRPVVVPPTNRPNKKPVVVKPENRPVVLPSYPNRPVVNSNSRPAIKNVTINKVEVNKREKDVNREVKREANDRGRNSRDRYDSRSENSHSRGHIK